MESLESWLVLKNQTMDSEENYILLNPLQLWPLRHLGAQYSPQSVPHNKRIYPIANISVNHM